MARAGRTLSVFTSLQESGAERSVAAGAGRRVYKGVTIIKSGLGNRRDRNYYPAETLEAAVKEGKFRNLKAYADHQDTISEEVQPERTIRDMVGVYKRERWHRESATSGRVVADLHLFRSSKWLSDTIDDLIDLGQASNIGLSINGRGQTVEKQMALEEASAPVTVNYVEAFTTLRSADVVTEAGAGGGFQELLESAKGTAQENTMKRLTEAQKAAIKKAVDANDPEKLQAVLAECGCMAAPAKEAKGTKKAKAAQPPTEPVAEADEDDADDADEALDAAVEEAKRKAEPKAEPEPEPEEVAEADDEDADGDDGDDADDADGEPEEADDVTEAMGHLPGGAGKFIKGTTPSGPGKATTPAKQRGKGKRSREADEPAPLTARERKLIEDNARLSAQLRVRTTADRARNLLRESAIPEKMRPEILPLMIGKSEDEMRKVIRYHERFIQTAIAEASGYSTEVEGVGSRFRESAGEHDAVDSALSGLPLKG